MFFCFTTHDTKRKTKTTIWIDGPSSNKLLLGCSLCEEDESRRPIQTTDLNFLICKPKGTVVEHDVNCDLTFMLNTICDIGATVQSKFDYLDDFIPVYLFMDNAGGTAQSQLNKNILIYSRRNSTLLLNGSLQTHLN